MREAQMLAAKLPNVGWATNADKGDTCNIHPGAKQFCGRRLGDSALALVYKQGNAWRSPQYSSAKTIVPPSSPSTSSPAGNVVAIEVSLLDVGATGLSTQYPWNMNPEQHEGENRTVTNCTMGSAKINNVKNQTGNQCAWAAIAVEGHGWVNATVSATGTSLKLEATLPTAVRAGAAKVIGSAYGWGPIPMMNAYDKTTGLPVLPWNRTIV
jgi:hypothetical protein